MRRRTLLAGAALAIAATATGGLSRHARAQEKVTKQDAKYQNQPKGQQRCEICVNFQPPNQCRFVQGYITPHGWCQFFAARDNAH